MDRVYVPQNNVDNVFDLGVIVFRDEVKLFETIIILLKTIIIVVNLLQVIRYGPIMDHLKHVLLDIAIRDRKGEVVDRQSFKSTCDMLVMLGIDSRKVYEEIFETPFFNYLAEFYKVNTHICAL